MKYLLLLLLAACGSPKGHYSVPLEAQPYIDYFELEANKRGIHIEVNNLIIEFQQDLSNKGMIGVCINEPIPKIVLDTEFFFMTDYYAEYRRKILMLHELGHCILNKKHVDYEESIMNSYLMSTNDFINNEVYFLDKFFGV